ncbi:MAG: hypothetical protein H6926_08250 [Chromatiales bacterium]|nr:hypothetical protein [Gammaproteobacteria bacterium]MCP5353156.1 hypothetical protein [Chromatiales bacterium]
MLIAFSPHLHATATGAYGTDCQACHRDASGGSPWIECGKDFYCAAREEFRTERDFDTASGFSESVLSELKTSAGITDGACGTSSSSTYTSLTSELCGSTSGGDTGSDGSRACRFDRGRITYVNTVEDLLTAHCVRCHAPRLTSSDLGDGYAVEPANLVHLHNWANAGSSPNRENIVNYTVYGALMPPVESELPLSDDELDDLAAWEKAGYPRGSAIGTIVIRSVTDATSRHFSMYYEATDTRAPWESGAIRSVARATAGAVSLPGSMLGSDDPNAYVAIFKTSSSEGFDPANDTLVKDCLPLGNVGLGYTLPDSDSGSGGGLKPATSASGYSLYACVYDGDNVYCDRWPERLNSLIRLSP